MNNLQYIVFCTYFGNRYPRAIIVDYNILDDCAKRQIDTIISFGNSKGIIFQDNTKWIAGYGGGRQGTREGFFIYNKDGEKISEISTDEFSILIDTWDYHADHIYDEYNEVSSWKSKCINYYINDGNNNKSPLELYKYFSSQEFLSTLENSEESTIKNVIIHSEVHINYKKIDTLRFFIKTTTEYSHEKLLLALSEVFACPKNDVTLAKPIPWNCNTYGFYFPQSAKEWEFLNKKTFESGDLIILFD